MTDVASQAPKKIVICFDGTADEIGKDPTTNVGKTYEMLRLRDLSVQVAYYDPGVGTLPSPQARGEVEKHLSILTELGLGHGMRAKIASAHTWLMQHYQPNDEIYVFGFSRGAYTARALIGMLNRPGLLRPGSENLVPYAVEEYTSRRFHDEDDPKAVAAMMEFADAFCWGTKTEPLSPQWTDAPNHRNWHAVPIKYLGIWDTVEAHGFDGIDALHWQSTRELHNVKKIRHAVSIDEWRRPYHDFLVHPDVPPEGARAEQVWFSGVHSDVGGTYLDAKLARITFKWVIDGVVEQLPLREADSYERLCKMEGDEYQGEVHAHFGWAWDLVGRHPRHIPDGASLHQIVANRRAWNKDYEVRMPANPIFVDPDWATLIPQDRLILPPT